VNRKKGKRKNQFSKKPFKIVKNFKIFHDSKRKKKLFLYQVAWSPRRYCKYAVTNKPAIVTGTNPNTIPESKGSTIKNIYKM
jgi:hypothetical protein